MKHNLYKMMGLDVYLSSLSKEEYEVVSPKISKDSRIITPLKSWDVYSKGYFDNLQRAEREQEIIKVKSYAKTLNWQEDIDAIFDKESYEAIIITDLSQSIVWVNEGFSKMTGYSKNEVLNKTPRFLQGDKTSIETKRKIKSQLGQNSPFKEIITNYRKNGETYKCEVKIFPLRCNNQKSHFIALERQVG